MKPVPNLPKPTTDLVREHLKRWARLENYVSQEKCLCLLFKEMCPSNVKLEHVLLKVTALNQFYSTNILDTYTVAKHISSLNIEKRLATTDYTLVNDIAMVTIKNKVKKFYSFASKYCSHHCPETFPIYDNFVKKMLIAYSKSDKFNTFTKEDLKEYPKFVAIIKAFREFYLLNQFTLKEIDVFLWLAGKDYFPKKHPQS